MADSMGGAPETRRKIKAPGAFRTISEVATDLEVPQHVLRFWESKFTQVKPLKRGGGRRYYRPEDVDLLRGIRHLLYSDGYTIKGVQKLLREIGSKSIMESGRSLSGPDRTGAAGVAAARTRRQGAVTEPQAVPQTVDRSRLDPSSAERAIASGNEASASTGLTAAQRGKLLELAVELGELRELLRRPATKS